MSDQDILDGADFSAAQGKVIWDAVANSKKISFAFTKISEGAGYLDPQWKNNWNGIKQAGFLRGGYHFGHNSNDPTLEADNFANAVLSVGLDQYDMLVLDMETSKLSGENFIQWILTWMERVESKTGVIPILYTGGPFFDKYSAGAKPESLQKILKYKLWLACYVSDPSRYVPKIYKDAGMSWFLWQCSGDTGTSLHPVLHLPGVGNGLVNVDHNLFAGTINDLKLAAASLHLSTDVSATQPAPDPQLPVEMPGIAPQLPVEPIPAPTPTVSSTPQSGFNLLNLIIRLINKLLGK